MKKMLVTTSWDDGHALDLRLAELLKRYGIKGTFYIAPEDAEIPKEKRLTDEQIRELSKDFEIGAHTLTHRCLTELSDEEARQEIAGSKEFLEKNIHKPIRSFCYPAGRYDFRHERMVREAGFTLGRTVERFATKTTNNFFALSTTVHAYRHWSDAWPILRNVGLNACIKCYLNWDELAIALFDQAFDTGGTFHLWGHSWEINQNGDWERLERVLQHISFRENVEYVTNAELVQNIKNEQKTVLFVTPYFLPHGGGLERYAYEMASRLHRERGWRVEIVTSGEKGNKDSTENYNDLVVRRLGYQFKISNTPFSFRWFGRVDAIIRELNPTLINIHMPVPGIGDIAAHAAGNRPVIVTYHAGTMRKGNFFVDIGITLYEHSLLQLLLRRADRIICSSPFISEGILKQYRYKSSVITPGVDTELFKPGKHKRNRGNNVLFVAGLGRAEQHKGLKFLIDAVKLLVKNITDIRLVVVGDGAMRTEYANYVARLNMRNSVIFKGRLAGIELVEAYQEARVFALPTSNDSFSMAVLEAMSSALPVISTPVGSIPELVDENETGFIIDQKDVARLARNIEKLLTNRSVSEEFGRAGRSKVKQRFEWRERSRLTDALFKETCLRFKTPLVVHLAAYYPPHTGGLERVARTAAEMLASHGREVLVLTSDQEAARGVEQAEHLVIKRLWSFEFAHTPIAPSLLWHLLALPRRSIMHLHLSQAYWPELVLLVSRLRAIPYVAHFHLDVGPSGPLGSLFILYKRLVWGPVLRNAERVIVFSQEQAELVMRTYAVSASRVSIIPNGVGEEFFRRRDSTPPRVLRLLSVGRLSPQKRIERLIETMSLLSIPARLIIVGDGEERPRLERLVKEKQLTTIEFAGPKSSDEVQTYLSESDVFLICSEREGMPLALLEAMASGLPIVGANVIGIRELVSGTGELIDEPYSSGFVKAIEHLSRHPARWETLSKRSSAKAREYAWSRLVVRLEALYADITR